MTFTLVTKRLQLLPLEVCQLRMQDEDPQALATSLGLEPQPDHTTDPELKSALKQMIQSIEAQPQDWPWNTNWLIVIQAERLLVGGCCFHGPANSAGEVEVGYGLDPAFRGRGYMTEALESLIGWAFSQANIVAVIAETEKENLPSQRVLSRLGMRLTREIETSLWWRLEKSDYLPSKE